jgi:ribosomal protein S18 acetylase RimI-like enzyme
LKLWPESREAWTVLVRRAVPSDRSRIWALNNIPNVGETADRDAPLDLPIPAAAPEAFLDLADVEVAFVRRGGDFIVVESDAHLVAMGGIRPSAPGQAQVRHVRVHPARRRLGIGRLLMDALERRATELGFDEMLVETASNQPEALAFYLGLGYLEVRRESRPEWGWSLVWFTKTLGVADRPRHRASPAIPTQS